MVQYCWPPPPLSDLNFIKYDPELHNFYNIVSAAFERNCSKLTNFCNFVKHSEQKIYWKRGKGKRRTMDGQGMKTARMQPKEFWNYNLEF